MSSHGGENLVVHRLLFVIGSVLQLTACAQSFETEGGTRLRVVQWVPEGGGPEVVAGFFDAELEMECQMLADASGQLRCMPRLFHVDRYFADADCLEPVTTGCSTDALVNRTEARSCGGSASFATYRRGASVSTVYRRESDECVQAPDVTDAFALERVPDGDLVAGEIQNLEPDEGERLGRRVIVPEDGARAPAQGWWDHELEVGCAPIAVAGERWPCVPTSNQARDLGEACPSVVPLPNDPECADRTYFIEVEYDELSCGVTRVALRRRGDALSTDRAAECVGVAEGAAVYETTPGPSLPEIDAAPEGDGRLRAYPRALDGPQYRDTELGIACSIERAADGEVRCLPYSLPYRGRARLVEGVFADPSCTEPAALGFEERCSDWLVEVAEPDACGRTAVAIAYRFAGAVEQAWQRTADGDCQPLEPTLDEQRVYALERVPLERFARLERREL